MGSTHTRVAATASRCGPTAAPGSPNAVRYAVRADDRQPGGPQPPGLGQQRPAAVRRSSAALSSSARAVARVDQVGDAEAEREQLVLLVGPELAPRRVKPQRTCAGQNRFPGRAKW